MHFTAPPRTADAVIFAMGQSASSDTSIPLPPAATKPAPRACAKPADPARIAALLIEFLPAPREDDDDDDDAETEDYASDDDDSLDDIVERVDDRSASASARRRGPGDRAERKPPSAAGAAAPRRRRDDRARRGRLGRRAARASLGAFETGYADVGGERTDAAEAADALAYELGGLLAAEARGDALMLPGRRSGASLAPPSSGDRDDGRAPAPRLLPWYHLDCPHNVAAAEDLAAGLIATCVAVASATAPRPGTFEHAYAPRRRFVTWLEQLPTVTHSIVAMPPYGDKSVEARHEDYSSSALTRAAADRTRPTRRRDAARAVELELTKATQAMTARMPPPGAAAGGPRTASALATADGARAARRFLDAA
ncbi:hypothetical protein JL721_13083 [Aureococcus anophagefferens]|nr:hypothetical protein JL721_13083 [Aureococcus anophagefferens]